jgi:hypothetical protein
MRAFIIVFILSLQEYVLAGFGADSNEVDCSIPAFEDMYRCPTNEQCCSTPGYYCKCIVQCVASHNIVACGCSGFCTPCPDQYYCAGDGFKRLIAQPTTQPSIQPSSIPSSHPTGQPSEQPTAQPSEQPTGQPSEQPTAQPSEQPTGQPSEQPTAQPSEQPTGKPSEQPSSQPSVQPSAELIRIRPKIAPLVDLYDHANFPVTVRQLSAATHSTQSGDKKSKINKIREKVAAMRGEL